MAIIISTTLPSGFVATYARPHSSPSLRLDSGQVELTVAVYKDAEARFAKAEPVAFDRHNITLSEDQRQRITYILYEAMAAAGLYPEGMVRDPDPEKVVTEPPVVVPETPPMEEPVE